MGTPFSYLKDYYNIFDDKMRQTEINNELVLLRQPVHQARICVVSKLIREAKKLRTYRGNEKQLEKNKTKSDKLLREVFALKHIKDDDISTFGIINFEYLQDILKNPRTDEGTRAMIKVARYKCLHERIVEFMEKFPDYREYISWKKKKRPSKRKGSNSIDDDLEENPKRSRKDTNTVKVSTQKRGNKNIDSTGTTNHLQCTTRQQKKINEQSMKLSKESAEQKLEGDESKSVAKVISKEAAVKRFAEVLQETDRKEEASEHEENNNEQSSNDAGECRKSTDDFFLSSDEAGSSVTVISAQRNEDPTSDIDHRAFKALRIRSKDEKFSKDKGEIGSGKDISYGPSNTRKTNVTHSKQNRDTRVKNNPVKRNVESDSTKTEDENLHPSWVARRKQQEILKQGFQGKKIKFDED